MPSLNFTTQVNAPVERVFDAFTDFQHAAENISSIKRIEILTDGVVGIGTRFRETRIMFRREATETMEVTEFQRPRLCTVEAESCGSKWQSTFRFETDPENAEGTVIQFSMRIEPRSFVARLFSPLAGLMMGSMRKCVEQDFHDLRALCESKNDPAGSSMPVGAPARGM